MQSESSLRRLNNENIASSKSELGRPKSELGRKSRTSQKIEVPGIRNHPRAGNFAGNLNQVTKTFQNHEQLRNLEKHEKHQETSGFIDFSTFKMNFRSADAANQLCALRVCEPLRVFDLLRQQKRNKFSNIKTNVGADFVTDTTNDTGTASDADTNNDSDSNLEGAV